jgi:Ser/Thr protein kinase RdoA (MazF antagonist)
MFSQSWPHEVLAHYPPLLRGPLIFLGNHGGFSGAHLWRLDCPGGSYCLKAWPTDGRSPRELAWIHSLLAKTSVFSWIPRVLPTSDGTTFVSFQDRLWELTTWLPGQASLSIAPIPARLSAACTALAELHRTWQPADRRLDVCPAIRRRWHSLQAWQQLLQSGWQPMWTSRDPYALLAEELWHRLRDSIDEVPRLLTPWLLQPVPLQPCVCDPWSAHVLFTGDAVTGLIDFGSAKEDHVAVDLARLLGSSIGDDRSLWEIGLNSYSRIQALSVEECRLTHILDRTGTILAATHWLRWLYHEMRHYDHPPAVMGRLAVLAERLKADAKKNATS